jgi:hypothetical protein
MYVSSWRGKAELNFHRIGDDFFLIGFATNKKHSFTLLRQFAKKYPGWLVRH